nr:MAG TPA: Muramidase (flagellum-specific) [Caudoviricetes sp.]
MRTFPVISTKYEHVNNFINTLAPVVCNAWIKYRREEKKTISPAVILAQAAKESGWNLGAASLFGIKGSDAEYDTTEYIDGEYINIKDSFEKYPDVIGAVYGYIDLMQWDNYNDATSANTVEGELYGLTNAVNNTDRDADGNWVGYNYATAPDYYETTLALINDFGLRVFNDYVWSVVNDSEDEENIEQPSQELDESVIDAIYRGEYGNDPERRQKLEAEGYNYADYQAAMEAKYYSSKDDTPAGNEEEPAEETPQEKEESVAVVEPGGSFCQIARDYLGDEGRAAELAEHNGMTLDDMLYAGMELRLPN